MDKIKTGRPIVARVTEALVRPQTALLDAARRAEPTEKEHARFADALPCLQAIEYRPAPVPHQTGERIRIAAWNAERCKYAAASGELIRSADIDLALLSELDVGMARSGNRDTIGELAAELGMGHAFGVEYVELGLGDDREKAWHGGQSNVVGLHGNGLLTSVALDELAIIRLDEGGRWFAGRQSTAERRIGWRMAIGARAHFAQATMFVVSVHLESSTDARDRARQCLTLIEAVDELAEGLPVIIGGDFNTADLPVPDVAKPDWFRMPQVHEPLFAHFADAGYDWTLANEQKATQRMRPDGTPPPPFQRIDWFFTRGLNVVGAETFSATDGKGMAISDHDLLVVTLNLRKDRANGR
jgi:endonuclease/exonuclease/phosphatase family metal-dependent hydrolase